MYKFIIKGFVPKVGIVTESVNSYDAAKAVDTFRSKYSFSVLVLTVTLENQEQEINKLKKQLNLTAEDEKVQDTTE